VAQQLRGLGFRNVRMLQGGPGGWANAWLAMEGKQTA
jgi:rhodanese-related sulfurtransferase